MAENFYTILTNIGKAKMANAYALGTQLNLTNFAVGDGNSGAYYNPTEDQTSLKHQVWQGTISTINIDADNPNWIVIEAVIPTTDGGFTVREAGVFDNEGNMIAVGKYPETYKPVMSEGSAKDLYIRMILEVSNTASVTLKVDPSIILATKKDIQTLTNQINSISFPVTKVNNKTGDVTLSASDVGAETPTGAQAKVDNLAGIGRTTENVKANADAIAALTEDVDAHKADSTYQVATGTATAITISTATLTNGYAKTFIASVNNNGAVTTINGKSLYKPNTTTAPTLIAGKAYTVWYNLGSDCFFIKASAEGNVTADKVLAGFVFSNDNDTGLVGTATIESLGGKKWASGSATSSSSVTSTFKSNTNVSVNGYLVTVSGLTFTPSVIIIYDSANANYPTIYYGGKLATQGIYNVYGIINATYIQNVNLTISATGFSIPADTPNHNYSWLAIE